MGRWVDRSVSRRVGVGGSMGRWVGGLVGRWVSGSVGGSVGWSVGNCRQLCALMEGTKKKSRAVHVSGSTQLKTGPCFPINSDRCT